MLRRRLVLSIGLLALGGCTEPNPAFAPVEAVCSPDEFFVGEPFTLADPSMLDILFVVDNSPGMAGKQAVLAGSMPDFVAGLNAVDGLSWRLGVTSTDLSQQGALLLGSGTGCPAEGPVVITNDTPNAGAQAACNVQLGDTGWDIEQGLESARRSVLNADTLFREDARRLIVFFADEDDCTAQESLDRANPENCLRQPEALVDEQQYASYFLSDAHPRSGSPLSMVAIVAPAAGSVPADDAPISPSCVSAGPAYTGDRYRAVVDRLADRTGSFASSICAATYAPVLERVLRDIVREPADSVCLSVPLLGEPRTVLTRDADGESVTLSAAGDYLALGATGSCPNGLLVIAADAHHGERDASVEVRFCTDTDPSGQ